MTEVEKKDVEQFIQEFLRIENEKKILSEDMKSLFEDYKDKLDTKALRAAIRIAKIRANLGDAERETDSILEVIDGKVR